jgi:hypothetical protein
MVRMEGKDAGTAVLLLTNTVSMLHLYCAIFNRMSPALVAHAGRLTGSGSPRFIM